MFVLEALNLGAERVSLLRQRSNPRRRKYLQLCTVRVQFVCDTAELLAEIVLRCRESAVLNLEQVVLCLKPPVFSHQPVILIEQFLVLAILDRFRVSIGWSCNREDVPAVLALNVAANVRPPHA